MGQDRPGEVSARRRSGQGALLDRQIGMQVNLGGLDALVSKPGAITEVSMPACSNRIAAECRKTCMVTDFCISVGQTPPAICTYFASLCSRASRPGALPERVTKKRRSPGQTGALGKPDPQGSDPSPT